jgi:putative transposase
MDAHWLQHSESVDVKSNRRNGKLTKQMNGSTGNFELSTPRDREGTFEPAIVKKRQTTITAEIDEKILSLYSHAMSYDDSEAISGISTASPCLTRRLTR